MSAPLRRGAFGRAAAVLGFACLMLFPAVAGDPSMTAHLDSLRQLRIDLGGNVSAVEAPTWRHAIDGDGSGQVSAQELATFVGALEQLIGLPAPDALEAYNLTWEAENASGALGFTLDGRANLSLFALARAPTLRVAASLDGRAGNLDSVALTFFDLSGPVGAATSIGLLETVVVSWGQAESRTVHRLEIAAPPRMAFQLQTTGGLEVTGFDALVSGAMGADGSSVAGFTQDEAAVVLVRDRPVTNGAVAIVIAAVLVPAVIVGYVALRSARGMRIEDSPLPVEPRYK